MIKGIFVPVETGIPEIVETEHNLETLQSYVEGNIEIVQLGDTDVNIIVNEEGKIKGLPINKMLLHDGRLVDFLAGNILIFGVDIEEGEIVSLPEEKIQKYIDMFSVDYIEI